MTDYTDLKARAEAAEYWVDVEPEMVLALIAENERLREARDTAIEQLEVFGAHSSPQARREAITAAWTALREGEPA